MTEEATSPESGTTEAPSTIFKEDGSLIDNWNTFAPEGYEELKESKTLPRIKKIWDLGKSYEHVRRQVPLDKMPVPNENFTDDDWKEFYKAAGRPDSPEGYNITKPKEYPDDEWNQDFVNSFQDIAFKNGISVKQASGLMEWYRGVEEAAKEAQIQKDELEVRKIEDVLYKEWGAAKPQKIAMGQDAVRRACGDDFEYKERLLDKINRDPDLIKFASFLGSKFIEAGAPMPGIPTPGDIQARIDKEMGNNLSPEERAKLPYWNKSHPQHNHYVNLVAEMFKEKERNTKTGFQS